MKKSPTKRPLAKPQPGYTGLISGIGELLESARHATARVVNSFMTATYWEVGRRIVEFEQGGKKRAEYGENLLKTLGADLSEHYGRGFGWRNLAQMKAFYLGYPNILQTVSAKSLPASSAVIVQTLSAQSLVPIASTVSSKSQKDGSRTFLQAIAQRFPLPWSHYVRLLSARSGEARAFYETEALRGGWSVRQLDRQINSLFYERTALSKDKAAMLKTGAKAEPGEALTAEEAIRDPLVLEFLNLTEVNYAREHWTHPDENPPVGIILCSSAGQNLVHYTLDNLPSKVLAQEYRLALPEEKLIAEEMDRVRRMFP